MNESARVIGLVVNGEPAEVPDRGQSLLDALRSDLRLTGAKDGCSPQGQCGCCTVLVNGEARVACVTPLRRVQGRPITTIEGLSDGQRRDWANSLLETGGSQCGFCTPGIVMRLVGLEAKLGRPPVTDEVEQALLAHLCRCTGWQTVVEAAVSIKASQPSNRDWRAAEHRAEIEGGARQLVSAQAVLGEGGFSADTAPADCLVAIADGTGGWVVAEHLDEARSMAGKVQGRRTTVAPSWPLTVPEGEWVRTLRTTWVEPAYLETDAAWCEPGGVPTSTLPNGGAFGGKRTSSVGRVAAELASQHGRAVLVLASREDTTRQGPKRPPVAAGIRADGTGIIRVVATPGIDEAIRRVAPSLVVEEVSVAGPPTSVDLRGAGWIEAAVLLSGLTSESPWITGPSGGAARATFEGDELRVEVRCGQPLDEVVLRSYCIGAAHQGWSWVMSESLAVVGGEVNDLTIRSFGITKAVDMPLVTVRIEPDDGPPVNGSDAVMAAVAAATWNRSGWPQDWPICAAGSINATMSP
ncbi:MAG: 2Fe-2S iron-sulfur cluster-binding protein [Acidimicrobiales bacterium]